MKKFVSILLIILGVCIYTRNIDKVYDNGDGSYSIVYITIYRPDNPKTIKADGDLIFSDGTRYQDYTRFEYANSPDECNK